MSEWQQYTDQVVHKMDYDTNQWADTNVCKAAAIYGPGDSGAWQAYAWTGDFPDLKEVDIEVDGLAGKETMKVDEINCAKEATKGNRTLSGGYRFGGVKYMLTYHDPEKKASQLVSPEGGAVVAATTTSLVIGIFDKNAASDGGAKQNVNSTFDQVVAMADYLKEQGI